MLGDEYEREKLHKESGGRTAKKRTEDAYMRKSSLSGIIRENDRGISPQLRRVRISDISTKTNTHRVLRMSTKRIEIERRIKKRVEK